MAVITRNTFDPLRTYVGVRLQQGVPIVDADENEREDVRQFELRAFLKWFVGNGIPEGNDGFRIEGTGLNNTFVIRAGIAAAPTGTSNIEKGLRHVGRCLVDGLDVIIENDLSFTSQPLYVSQAGSAARAATLGVPVIQGVPGTGPVVAYLDVWNRLVMPSEDSSLVHAALGTESCARIKREWVVRVRAGTNVPVSPDADFIAGHSYYALATITRRAGDPVIAATDVADRRERRLLIPPANLITDLFGTNPADYRAGIGRPAISLREAINALLRGEIPATVDIAIAPAPGLDAVRRGFLTDQSNGIVAVWTSPRVGSVEHVFASRIDQDDLTTGFMQPPLQVTSGAARSDPHATLLSNGELIVTYRGGLGASADIFYKRAAFAQLGTAPEQPVINVTGAQTMPSVLVSGNLAVFIFFNQPTNRLQYRRLNLTTNVFTDTAPVEIPAPANAMQDYHATLDAVGGVWIAFRMGIEIRALRLNPNSGAIEQEASFNAGAGSLCSQPFVLFCPNGPAIAQGIFVFWTSAAGLHVARHTGASWETTSPVPAIPNTAFQDAEPSAIQQDDGGIWLFWTRPQPSIVANTDILFMRRNPQTTGWGQPRQVTTSLSPDSASFPLLGTNKAIWLFWARVTGLPDVDVYFKRIATAV